MATSLHACYPNTCKNQHQMKALAKSPNVVRRSQSTRQNTANRRSAVERLEESKANYVKSERVLDTKQEFKNSSHLRVTTAPQLDILYKTPTKFPPDNLKLANNTSDEIKLSYLRVQHQPCPQQVSKSPPAVRTRAKSHSEFRDSHLTRKHSFASQGRRHRIEVLIDIESQLKQLITTGSRENVSAVNDLNHAQLRMLEVPKVRRGYSDPVRKSCWKPPDLSPDDNFIHKSMPDLSPSPQKPCPSLSSSGESNNAKTEERISYVVPKRKPNINVPIQATEQKDEDMFDPMFREPRRFSNGTGMLHLTPYYSASSQLQRKPVSRSKSDVSHRYSKPNFPRRNNYTNAEIERFFDTMGLDTSAWHHVTSPSSISSPPCFFESVSSVDSNDDRNSECSDDESLPGILHPKEGLRNHDLRVHGPLETSIVEKNARVIKWLYNCRKASYDS